MTDPRPADVPWLTPYLTVRDARVSVAFYEKALGFAVRDSVNDDGTVIHVEMTYRGLDHHVRAGGRIRFAGAPGKKRRANGAAVVLPVCR